MFDGEPPVHLCIDATSVVRFVSIWPICLAKKSVFAVLLWCDVCQSKTFLNNVDDIMTIANRSWWSVASVCMIQAVLIMFHIVAELISCQQFARESTRCCSSATLWLVSVHNFVGSNPGGIICTKLIICWSCFHGYCHCVIGEVTASNAFVIEIWITV